MNIPMENQTMQNPLPVAPIPVIKVLGMGGGGSNAINRMIELGLSGVEYIAANTDAQALRDSLASHKIQLGPLVTRGLGAGGDPSVGEAAAEESRKVIHDALAGADMVFITAGMGGGTGTGSVPVAARISRELGAVTVGIVTTPFSFEIGRRQRNAQEGLAKLRRHTDTLITVPNDRLLKIAPRDLPLELAFRLADDVLRQGIQGISQLVTQPGMINVDFAHVRHMMMTGGGALLAIGYGQGPNRTMQAVKQALNHPLLESISLQDATGIIANFTGGNDLAFVEVVEAMNYLHNHTHQDTDIIPGINCNSQLRDRVEVILVITGLGGKAVDQHTATQRQNVHSKTELFGSPIEIAVEHETEPVSEFVGSFSDFDVPAFIRRKTKID